MFREVRVPEVKTLFVFKLFSKFSRFPGADVEDAREGEGMSAVGVLPPVHLQPRVVDADSEVAGVVVGPEHVVYVEYDGLPGHVQYGGLLHLLSCEARSVRGRQEGQ